MDIHIIMEYIGWFTVGYVIGNVIVKLAQSR